MLCLNPVTKSFCTAIDGAHTCNYKMLSDHCVLCCKPVTSYLFVLSFAFFEGNGLCFCAKEKVITILFLFVFVYTSLAI